MKIDASQPLEYGTEENRNRIFGFWLFLGAEIALFATLFTVYFVLADRHASGPSGAEIFEITPVLLETFVLLTSSFTIGLAVHAMRLGLKKQMMIFMIITLLLGAGFLGIEIFEFFTYVHEGVTLSTSAFASSLFTLLGTHGAHVTFGLLWGPRSSFNSRNTGWIIQQRTSPSFSRCTGISLMLSGSLSSALFI